MKKSFTKNYLPDWRFKKITDIKPDFFSGAQLVIFDLDNTLVFSETTKTSIETLSWFSNFKKIYKCVIVSNSWSFLKRAKIISQIFDCDVFLSKHKKPFKKLFQEIKNKYKFDNDKVFVVGDRIFTDILFGNLNGAETILVKPLSSKENIFIKIIRKLENLILFLSDLRYN